MHVMNVNLVGANVTTTLNPQAIERLHQELAGRLTPAQLRASAGPLRVLSEQAAQQGDTTGALALLTTALAAEPNHAVTWYSAGTLLSKHGRFDEAEQAYETALNLDDKLFDCALALARTLLHGDNPTKHNRARALLGYVALKHNADHQSRQQAHSLLGDLPM